MGIVINDYTGRVIYEAIEKNGVPIIREAYFNEQLGETLGACLIGVAAVNLGVVAVGSSEHESRYEEDVFPHTNTLEYQLNRYRLPNGRGLASYIINQFDEKREIYEEVENRLGAKNITYPAQYPFDGTDEDLQRYRERVDEYNRLYDLEEKAFLDSLDPTQIVSSDPDEECYYTLSYTDALAMVKEVLTPYFDTVFQIAVEDYKWEPQI